MLRIELLPARHGDSVLIEYGSPNEPSRILIDGGTESSAPAILGRLRKIGSPAKFELVVVTHVDEDHIGGILEMMIAKAFETDDFWFNSYHHLFPPKLGGPMGEGLTTAIRDAGFAQNKSFGGLSVVVEKDGKLPEITLPGGATITLLSPTWPCLEKLRPKWQRECEKAGIMPGKGATPTDVLGKRDPPISIDVHVLAKAPFNQDRSAANGSCISFLLQYDGKRVLLGADAHPSVVLASLKRYSDTPVTLDAFKVFHHGSRNNTNTKLLSHIRCARFLVSTNGKTFGHPDPEAIARIVSCEGDKQMCFNYESPYSRPWNKQGLRDEFKYDVMFPDDDEGGIVVELSA